MKRIPKLHKEVIPMTIHELSTQLHNLSVGGYFNGEKFTKRQLEHYIASSFRPEVSLKAGNQLVMEIALRDGRWFFTINRWSDKPDGFDYTIPDNRDQEARIISLLQ